MSPRFPTLAEVAQMGKMVQLTQEQFEALTAAASGNGPFAIKASKGVSKRNGKPYDGFTISGPARGYLSRGLLKAIHDNPTAVAAALK